MTYSYWDGGAAPYNYTEGTRTTLESHGTGNETAHNEVFTLWDAVSPFSLDEVPEDGDGDPVGDLRWHSQMVFRLVRQHSHIILATALRAVTSTTAPPLIQMEIPSTLSRRIQLGNSVA